MDTKKAGVLIAACLLGIALVGPATVTATKPDPAHKVTICHRTNSVTNPYRMIDVDVAAVDGVKGGDHLLKHVGPAFDFSADPDVKYPTPRNGDQWGDIIPPFYSDGKTPTGYPSLNWDATGQAIFYAGCAAPPVTTETTDELTTTTTSTDTETTATTTTPEGEVEDLTPPSTDTVAAPTSGSSVSTGLLLLLAGLCATGLVAARTTIRSRR